MGCATASGVFRRCSSGSASRARRPAPRTRRATRPRRRPSKNQLPARLQGIAAEHPGERLQIWCQDEARIGQKGRTTRVWYERGVRPPGLVDQRYKSLYLFAACRPGTGEAFALVLPRADAGTMRVFLEPFSRQLAPDGHVLLVLDQAGWYDERALSVPKNITLLPLPSASPQLNPVERVWLYVRERYLSHRVLDATTPCWTQPAEPGTNSWTRQGASRPSRPIPTSSDQELAERVSHGDSLTARDVVHLGPSPGRSPWRLRSGCAPTLMPLAFAAWRGARKILTRP